jgi:hypothetical protein
MLGVVLGEELELGKELETLLGESLGPGLGVELGATLVLCLKIGRKLVAKRGVGSLFVAANHSIA